MADKKVSLIISAIDNTNAAFRSLNNNLTGLQNRFSGIASFFRTAITAVPVLALVSAVKKYADEGENMLKTSQQIGISVEKLSGLKYAAEMSETSLEDLTTGVGRLSKNLAAAAGGSKEAQAKFKAYKIEVVDTNGHIRDTYDVLLDIADLFAKTKDGAGKAAIAQSLMGKSALANIPFFNEGARGIKAYQEEVERLGMVWTPERAKAADDFNDSFTRLNWTLKALSYEILPPLIRGLQDFLNLFNSDKKKVIDLSNEVETLTERLIKLKEDLKFQEKHRLSIDIFTLGESDEVIKDTKLKIQKTNDKLQTKLNELNKLISKPAIPSTKTDEAPFVDEEALRKAEQLAEAWKTVKTSLTLDMRKSGLDEFSQKIEEIKSRSAELIEKFKSIPGAGKLIKDWLESMTGDVTKAEAGKQYAGYMEAQSNIAEKAKIFEREMTEAGATELDKRLLDVDEWARKKNDTLLSLWGTEIKDLQLFEDKKTEITTIAGNRRKKIIEENQKAIREASINYQLAEIDIKEKDFSISIINATHERLRLQEELLNIQEQYLLSIDKLKDPSGWYAQADAIQRTRDRLLDLNKQLKELTGTVRKGLNEGFKKESDAINDYTSGLEAAVNITGELKSGLADFFDYASEKFGDLEELAKNVFHEIYMEMVKSLIINPLTKDLTSGASGLIGLIGDLFRGSYSGSGSTYNSGKSLTNPNDWKFSYHGGGAIQSYYVPRFHVGGLNSDEGLIVAQDEEFMISRKGVRAYGTNFLNKINRGEPVDSSFIINVGGINVAGGNKLAAELRNEIEQTVIKVVRRHS